MRSDAVQDREFSALLSPLYLQCVLKGGRKKKQRNCYDVIRLCVREAAKLNEWKA
jgi:hypothetical protein